MSEKNINSQSNIVWHDGQSYWQDPISLNLMPVALDEEPSVQESAPTYQPAEKLPVKNERSKVRISSKIWLGVGALSLVALPPSAHFAADSITNSIMNVMPGPDHTIPKGGLIKDLEHTIDQLLPGGNY